MSNMVALSLVQSTEKTIDQGPVYVKCAAAVMTCGHVGNPLNLSILISGGKETKQDSLSSGE